MPLNLPVVDDASHSSPCQLMSTVQRDARWHASWFRRCGGTQPAPLAAGGRLSPTCAEASRVTQKTHWTQTGEASARRKAFHTPPCAPLKPLYELNKIQKSSPCCLESHDQMKQRSCPPLTHQRPPETTLPLPKARTEFCFLVTYNTSLGNSVLGL